jgi:hypothetical protein
MLTDPRRDDLDCDTECEFVGTTAAILIAAGIAAGGGVAAAKIQSNAANKGLKAQEAATDKAIANLQPYNQMGTEAFQTLGGLMGLGGGGGAPGGPTNTAGAPISPQIQQARAERADPMGAREYGNPIAKGQVGNATYVDQTGSGYSPPDYTRSPVGGMAPSAVAGTMFQVRAPDGSIRSVPQNQLAAAKANGGTVLNG